MFGGEQSEPKGDFNRALIPCSTSGFRESFAHDFGASGCRAPSRYTLDLEG
jgi:hypothetical protein